MKKIFMIFIIFMFSIIFMQAQVVFQLPDNDLDVTVSRGIADFNTDELYGEPGQPLLPVYSYTLLLPPDADLDTVTFSLDTRSTSRLTGEYDVDPADPPTTSCGVVGWPNEEVIVDGRDVTVYNVDAAFPGNPVTVIDKGQLNAFKIVEVKVNRVQFNPVAKSLYRLDSTALTVNYERDAAYTKERAAVVKIPAEVVARVERRVDNASEFINNYIADFDVVSQDTLVIVTTNNIKGRLSSFDAFVAAKEAHGFKVIVATEDQWGGGTGSTGSANIRKWLQDNYQTLGINYCLLIGSPSNTSGDVPMGWFTGYSPWSGHTNCPSDWFYEQLTGDYKNDYQTELYVGRFPVFAADYESVNAIMQKTIDYGNTPESEASWRYNVLMGGPGYDSRNTAWASMNPAYDQWIAPNPDWNAYRCYSDMYATPVGADKVSDNIAPSWAEGSYGLVDWCAHGAPTLAQGAMSSKDTKMIGNKYPSFANCASCSNADIRYSNNLTYSILRDCGIGAMGGTDYTMVGDDMQWARYFVKYMAHEKMNAGQAFSILKADHSTTWYNRGPYVLYGDPTVGIYTFNAGPTPTPTVTPTPTATPTATPIYKNVALDQPVMASGQYSDAYPMTAVNDGNDETVWGSLFNAGPQWIYIDLGESKEIADVIIKYYDPYYAPTYYVGVSDDAVTWDFAAEITDGNGGEDKITINRTTRYVGLYLTNGAMSVYGIKELEAYTLSYPTTPTPTPTMTPTPTATPTATPTPNEEPWKAGVSYNAGDLVSYNGKSWQCTQAHTSNVSWYPGAPGVYLWKEI